MYRLFTLKSRTARKQHTCIWCGERVESNTKYLHEKSIYEDNFQNHKWHFECYDYARSEFDGEFTPYINERPKEIDND